MMIPPFATRLGLYLYAKTAAPAAQTGPVAAGDIWILESINVDFDRSVGIAALANVFAYITVDLNGSDVLVLGEVTAAPPGATAPVVATQFSAAIPGFLSHPVVLRPGERVRVDTVTADNLQVTGVLYRMEAAAYYALKP